MNDNENANSEVKVYLKQDELEWETLNSHELDYTQYKDGSQMLTILEDDGTRWATAFAQFYKQKYNVDINVEYAFIWFANAIEHSNQLRKEREAAVVSE